jgi:hypothetical protein
MLAEDDEANVHPKGSGKDACAVLEWAMAHMHILCTTVNKEIR